MLNSSRDAVSRFAIAACMAAAFSAGGLVALPQAALARGGGGDHGGGVVRQSFGNNGPSGTSQPGHMSGAGNGKNPITVVRLPNGRGRGETRREARRELREIKHCEKDGHCAILVSEHGPLPKPIGRQPINGTPAPAPAPKPNPTPISNPTPAPMPTPTPTPVANPTPVPSPPPAKPPVLGDPGYGAPGTGGGTTSAVAVMLRARPVVRRSGRTER
jgi:hypothetical protein